jgi:hypothetical protein
VNFIEQMTKGILHLCQKGNKNARSKLYERIREVKNFELPITELIDYKIILICIYRSPARKFDVFLNKLELIIQELSYKN